MGGQRQASINTRRRKKKRNSKFNPWMHWVLLRDSLSSVHFEPEPDSSDWVNWLEPKLQSVSVSQKWTAHLQHRWHALTRAEERCSQWSTLIARLLKWIEHLINSCNSSHHRQREASFLQAQTLKKKCHYITKKDFSGKRESKKII